MDRGVCLLLVALTGCGISNLDVYTCHEPDEGHKEANGEPDPCHYNDDLAAGDAGSGAPCPGVCVALADGEWIGPQLVWMGDEAAAPPCPANARLERVELRRPALEKICPTTCSCTPPTGSCALPATVTASSLSCYAPGAVHASFDPPASWTGTCTPANAIPLGQLCGGVPCVQSVTIAPLVMTESGCQPIEQPTPPQPARSTFARVCSAPPFPRCDDDYVCVPAAPGPDFRQCIRRQGDPTQLNCPSTYPDRSVFYDEFVDTRYCAPPCTCGAPGTQEEEKSTCRGSMGLFSDPGCSAPLIGPILSIDAVDSKCYDVPLGSALESKSASEPKYRPGACPVTGGELGKIAAGLTYVICCQGTQ
ncbi:MAG: hypothetical protein ACMG6S_02635 [Byssovorax sp.]